MTGIQTLDLRGDPEADITPAVESLRAGGLIACPTETVYGVSGGCGAEAVAALRTLKAREESKPFIVLVASLADVEGLRWTESARTLASIFWPGSVTLILSDPDHVFPSGVRSASGAVAVRWSPHPIVQRLLEGFGEPITSTSLNAPGAPPARSADEARAVLAALAGEDVLLIDTGTLPPSGPSTVIDCTTETPVVVREGVVPTDRLRCAITEIHGHSI